MSIHAFDIQPVKTPSDRKVFMRLATPLYADDPHYIVPLEFELGARLDAGKNPTLKSSPHRLWIAYRNGAPVGRIAAILNRTHLERHRDGAGHFGFLEGVDDAALFDALMGAAGDWLKAQGAAKIAGPFNFSINEECGLLIDGFDSPPYIMMPHGRPYYQSHLERLGFSKAADMYALEWIPRRDFIPEERLAFVNKVLARSNVSIRNLNAGDLLGDIRTIIDIFNDAWWDNWGFIPFGEAEARHMASELRPIIEKYNMVVCYLKGEPVAFGLVLPNVNRTIRDFNGRLLPFNWAKLLWRLKVKGVDQARMPLMGVKKRLQKKPVGAALAYKVIDVVTRANIDHGLMHSEMSWILETNPSMLSMLQDMGGRIYKTYRIYEKAL